VRQTVLAAREDARLTGYAAPFQKSQRDKINQPGVARDELRRVIPNKIKNPERVLSTDDAPTALQSAVKIAQPFKAGLKRQGN
jgi:hypothetical protein